MLRTEQVEHNETRLRDLIGWSQSFLASPSIMAKPACFRWLRWHWRWLVGVLLTVLVVILYFVRPDFGAILGATWLYFKARYILKDQASPFPRRVGATLVVLMVLGSTFVMLIPWIFFGGRDGCRSFDPSMKNEFGYAFEDYWTLRSCQSAADWLMVLALAYSLIADHSPSSYVRESIRCIAFMFPSMLVRNASFAVYACSGSDENLDGVRDNVLLRDFKHLEYHLVARSTAVFFSRSIAPEQRVVPAAGGGTDEGTRGRIRPALGLY